MKKKTKWWLSGITFLFVTAIAGWGAGIWWLWASGAPNAPNATSQNIRLSIPEGTPLQTIGEELEAAGVIRSKLALRMWLQWLSWKEGDYRPLRAGTYDLSLNQPLAAIVSQMQSAVAAEVRFTIPEGWAIAQMGEYFEEKGFFSEKEFIAAATGKSLPSRRSWLPNDISSLEGYLFPDTYQLQPSEITPDRILDLMLDRFEQVALTVYRENQSGLNKAPLTLNEWVTFASIVEKEAVLEGERKTIAGVFWQRLRKNMRLESDPTVEYALKIKQTPDKPLTFAQVKTPSPFNTYLNAGLPPGAIASPGIASLKAILEPEKTDFLYFVARYDGSHIFSRTLDEHQKAIQQVESQLSKQKK